MKTTETQHKLRKGSKAWQAIQDRMAAMRAAKAEKAAGKAHKPRKAVAKAAKAVKPLRAVHAIEAQADTTIVPIRQHRRGQPLYRGDYGRLFELGSHKVMTKDDLIKAAAKAMRKPAQKIAYDLQVLTNPKHRSNGQKSCNVARRKGWVRLAPIKAA
jgi:hypothetical protein